MLEISPVLAGTFDAPNYVPPHDIASTQTGDAQAIDTRRYTKFDHSATEAGSTTDFSFGDFLDMINPLQHIPIVSSVYREITGEQINPVSRITGDILFGGFLGIGSAVLGGMGAAGDALMEAQSGKDSVGNVVASLFGSSPSSSPDATAQLADAGSTTTAQTAPPAAASSAAPLLPKPALPQIASAAPAAAGMDATTQALIASKTFALDPKKLPYGGVIDPSQMQGGMASPLQGSNMALALAASAPGLQMNHTVYTNPTMSGARAFRAVNPSTATPANGQVANATAINPTQNTVPAANPQNPLPPELMQDIATLRAINQYKSTASQSTPPGSNVNVVN